MYYIDPLTTTDAHLLIGTTLAEDPTSAWASGTFAVGDERHVVATHRVYRCQTAGSSTLSPELDATRWKDMRPTNLWAPFDIYTSTAAVSTSADITYVLASRYVNAIMLRGLEGKSVTISIKDAPGGAVIFPAKTYSLKYAASGYWDYAYGNRRARPSLNITGLPIRSNAEITITVSATGINRRAIGLIERGKLRALHGTTDQLGGTQKDADAIPKTFTYRKVNPDGTVQWLLRGGSKDLQCEVIMPISQADQAVQVLEGLLGRPLGWIATLVAGHVGLSAFGFATKSPVRYKDGYATCSMYVEGVV